MQEELTLVWLLLITTVLTSFFIQRYHVQYIPPSGAAMILGMACGGIAKAAGECLFAAGKRANVTAMQQRAACAEAVNVHAAYLHSLA